MVQIFNLFIKTLNTISIIIFVSLTFIVILQVISRMLLVPLQWTLEIAQLGVVVTVFVGLGVVEYSQRHIKVDVVGFLPKNITKIIDIFGKVISILTLIFIAYGILQMLSSTGNMTTPTARVPISWIYNLMIVGILCWIVTILVNRKKYIKNDEENDLQNRGGRL